MSVEELNKIIELKKMDLEECEQEINNRYYPSIVRIAITSYMSELRQQLEMYNDDKDLNKIKNN